MTYNIIIRKSVFKPEIMSAIYDADLTEALHWYEHEIKVLDQMFHRSMRVETQANGQRVNGFYHHRKED